MVFDPDKFIIGILPAPASIVLGKQGVVNLTASNLNTGAGDTAYNLTLVLTLPDGISYVSSSILPTSQVTTPTAPSP